MLALLGHPRVIEAQHPLLGIAEPLGYHRFYAPGLQHIGVPRGIRHEVLQLLQCGIWDDQRHLMDALSPQVRDQPHHVVGTVLHTLFPWKHRPELRYKSLHHGIVDLAHYDLHGPTLLHRRRSSKNHAKVVLKMVE